MGTARQTTREFKGDHISAKMYRRDAQPFARMIPVFDAEIISGSKDIVSSSAGFSTADIGSLVVVHAANFGGSAHKSVIESVVGASHAVMRDVSPASLAGLKADIGPDDTATLLYTCVPSGTNGAGIERLIPSGCYLVTPGALVIPNPQSGILRGQGTRFNTIIRSNDPDSSLPVLTLGNGTFEPHSWVMQNLTISKGYGPGPALYLNRLNIMAFRDIIITDLGIDGIGIDSNPSSPLLGEMIFDHVSVYGGDGLGSGTPVGTIGVRLYATSNIELISCNIEAVDTALIFTGNFTQSVLRINGGHIEAIGYHAFILNNCQPFIEAEVHTGDTWLGNDVLGGDLQLFHNAPSWVNGAVVDNGFGNRIRRISSGPLNQTGGIYNAGLSFDGDEWLRVPSLCQDPLWLYGTTGWSGTNATPVTVPVVMPGTKYGKAMAVVDGGSGGGYVEKTFTATANTDYLLQVGILQQKSIEHQIEILDGSGSVWDSGAITNTYTSNDSQTLKVIRKRIPVASDTTFTVRLYSPVATKWAVYPMLLISKSEIRSEVDYVTTGTGFSSSGSGVSFAMTQDLNTGTVYTFKLDPHYDLRHRGRAFFRCVVNCPDGVGGGRITVGGGFSSPQTGPQPILREGAYEYIVPLMTAPENSVVVFGGFVPATLSVDISETGVFFIDDNPNVVDYLKVRNRNMEAIDSTGNFHLPVTTSFADEDRLTISNVPNDGTVKTSNILSIPAAAFGPNQGLIAAVNSKYAGFPNWQQTSRVYTFASDSGTNCLIIATDGYWYEDLNMPFTGESFVAIASSGSGLTDGINYWLKRTATGGVYEYEVYDDDGLTSRMTLSTGSGSLASSPYALFLLLAAGLFGFGFGDATNTDGVSPWASDPYNVSSAGPPLLIASRYGTSAVKETARASGIYTGYPIFPMWNGGPGIFFCSGDPAGQLLWDGLNYPPLGSVCLRGDGGYSIRIGPVPTPDDGSGWADLATLVAMWVQVDANTIGTPFQVRIGDGSTRDALLTLLPKTTQIADIFRAKDTGGTIRVIIQPNGTTMIDADLQMGATSSDRRKILVRASDPNHYLVYDSTIDGPMLSGYGGVTLARQGVSKLDVDIDGVKPSGVGTTEAVFTGAAGQLISKSYADARTELDVYAKTDTYTKSEVDALIAAAVAGLITNSHQHAVSGDTGNESTPGDPHHHGITLTTGTGF